LRINVENATDNFPYTFVPNLLHILSAIDPIRMLAESRI
jgi:hypothetical protein